MFARQNMLYAFFLAVAIIFGYTRPVAAVEISPLRQTIVVDPGARAVVRMSVRNDTNATVHIVPAVVSFSLDGVGRPLFNVHDPAESWVEPVQTEVVLRPGQSQSLGFDITIPSNIESSEHFLALYAKTMSGAGQIGLSTQVGSLLFLHVGGVVDETAVLQEFTSDHSVVLSTPFHVLLALKNVGSIHVIPEGTIEVKNWRGQIIERVLLNPNQKKVFPNTFWENKYELGARLHWWESGPVTVQAVIFYGQSHQALSAERTIWFVSPWALSIFFVVVVIVMLVRRVIRRSRINR